MGRVRMVGLVVALLLPAGCWAGEEEPGPPPETTTTTVPGGVPSAGRAELPVPRTEVAAAVLRGRIVVVGGLNADGGASERVDIYDPEGDRWEAGPALPVGLHHSGMASLGDRVWVVGGYTSRPGVDWVAQSRVLSLGSGERAWRDEPALPAARGGLAAAAAAGRLVAMGGTDAFGRFQRKTEVFTPGQRAWVAGPDMTQPRDHLAAASSGGRIYAIGGRLGSLESNQAQVESWDPAARPGWRVEPELNDRRGGTSAADVGGRPCVAGGEEPGRTIPTIECLVDGAWKRVAGLRVPRHGLGVVALGTTLHVIAGGPEPGLFVSAAHEAFVLG